MNLTTSQWIRVLTKDGKVKTISLLELFSGGLEYRQLMANGNPMVVPSITRFLVALVTDALRTLGREPWMKLANDDDWQNYVLYCQANGFPRETLVAYLEKHADRFEMTGKNPFLQTSGIGDCPDKEWSVNNIDLVKASGDNAPCFFDHSFDGDGQGRTMAECANLLIVLQMSSIKSIGGGTAEWGSSTKGMIGRGGVVVIADGDSIAETVALNSVSLSEELEYVRLTSSKNDLPAWRRNPMPSNGKVGTHVPSGICDYLTSMPRRVLLRVDEDGLVRKVRVLAGESIPKGLLDPHLVYTQEGRMVPYRYERDVIRDIDAIVGTRQDVGGSSKANKKKELNRAKEDVPHARVPVIRKFCLFKNNPEDSLRLNVYGLCSMQSKPLQFCDSKLSLPLGVMSDEAWIQRLCDGERSAEDVAELLKNALKIFAKEVGVLPRKPSMQQVVKCSIINDGIQEFWSSIAPLYEEMFVFSEPTAESFELFKKKAMNEAKDRVMSLVTRQAASAKQIRAFVMAYDVFEKEEVKPMASEERNPLCKALFGGIAYDNSVLSRIRSSGWKWLLTGEPILRNISPFIRKEDGGIKTWDLNCCGLAAFAYALSQRAKLSRSNRRSFGWSMRTSGRSFSQDRKDSRFRLLMSCSDHELFDLMETSVRYCVSSESGIDCDQLLRDLLEWRRLDGAVKLKWAIDYYSRPAAKKVDATERKEDIA